MKSRKRNLNLLAALPPNPLGGDSRDCASRAAAVLACALAVLLAPAASGQFQYQRLKSFGFPELSGTSPRAPLVQGTDGNLYGTTVVGGVKGRGTVFRLNKGGSGYKELHGFSGTGGDRFQAQQGRQWLPSHAQHR
ncbi:MAG: hypothetical protein L0Z50_33790 [Verrucomicrobiales bacterium]|nr:hypothetical protein [Verrucomicrobiales bacterium]